MNLARDLFGYPKVGPRFVVFSSYGNDSVALIQWAFESGLEDVAVVYSDTKWAAPWWEKRVWDMEQWVESLGKGFWTDRTDSIGFVGLAHKKKAFPTQQFQWCSLHLKIEPGAKWLESHDPEKRAVCLVGVRRDEGKDRANFPRYDVHSGNHGGRVMIAPFADYSSADRDALLVRAGVVPLPHRSMECSPCINSNRSDLRALTEDDIRRVEGAEKEMNDQFGLTSKGNPRTLFRPHRYMGATGIREVKRWADGEHGKFAPLPSDEDSLTCNNGYCSN